MSTAEQPSADEFPAEWRAVRGRPMGPANSRAVHVKARAVVRRLGHSDGEAQREYKDWHLEIRGGAAFITIWHSGRMVFLSMGNVPVFHVSGPWEEYLERLFQRTRR